MTSNLSPILKLNYQDFYKFLTSFAVILLIISSAGLLYSLKTLTSYLTKVPNLLFISICFFIILGGFGLMILCFGMYKWYQNQIIIDEKLSIELNNEKLIALIKKVEYEKKIDELAENEEIHPFEMTNLSVIMGQSKSFKREKARKRISG